MWLLFQLQGKRAIIFLVFMVCVFIVYGYYALAYIEWSENASFKFTRPPPADIFKIKQDGEKVASRENSELETQATQQKSYVVNTPTCKIPDLNPWDEDILRLSGKCEPSDETDPKCSERPVRKWMYTQDTNLLVNYSAVKESGYSMSSIRCCYYVIKRVEQSRDNHDMNADLFVKYSQECYPIPLYDILKITQEFIRVFCISNSWPLLNDVVYREYFAFALPDDHAQEKISKWKSLQQNNEDTPPSIVILGPDTNSRLNSHRRLNQTLRVLSEMGAIELFGYTKVGENTLPNTMAFLGGLTRTEMESVCNQDPSDPFDDCPFIWKDFDRVGYLTATVEEAPYACGFNYLATGFVKKPTDFYYRPFSLALMKQPRETLWFGKCVGRYYSTEVPLNYLTDILQLGSRNKTPVFIHSWMAVFGHHCINSVRFVDTAYSRFISKIDKDNTILVFMSDHGDRYGPFRETTLGWYEDKLPSMWMYLPVNVRKRFPMWNSALQTNSRRLTSHFDLFHTFAHILNAYNSNSSASFTINVPRNNSSGQSLFEIVPENRTCANAGIPESYCACTEPVPIDINSEEDAVKETVTAAVSAAMSYLRSVLPKECARPTVKRLVSGKVMLSQSSSEVYLLSLYTDPGDFLFEITVKARKVKVREGDGENKKTFSVNSLNDILRMNKITRKVNCVSTSELERYCYCL